MKQKYHNLWIWIVVGLVITAICELIESLDFLIRAGIIIVLLMGAYLLTEIRHETYKELEK